LQCVDVARGLALLFGLGTKALPVWDSKTRWNNLWVDQLHRRTQELSEALEQQTATSEVLRVISSSPSDAQPVFDTIAKSVTRLCKAQFCHVFRFDGKLLHFGATHGYAPEVTAVLRATFPIAPGRGSAAARSILSGAVEEIPDILADHDYEYGAQAKIMNYRSIVAVPMLKDDRPIGAIAITQPHTGHFPERQIDLLRTFADQAVIAIENVRLFEAEQQRTRELSESLEQQTATTEVLRVISSSPGELEPVFQTMLANVCGFATRNSATCCCARRVDFEGSRCITHPLPMWRRPSAIP
jgi:two-component system, NtrC family, sensor kinase